MYHQSTDYNFMEKPLTPERVDEIITAEENNGDYEGFCFKICPQFVETNKDKKGL